MGAIDRIQILVKINKKYSLPIIISDFRCVTKICIIEVHIYFKVFILKTTSYINDSIIDKQSSIN